MGVRVGGHAGPVYASAPVPSGCGTFFAVVFGLPLCGIAMWNMVQFWPMDLILGCLIALGIFGSVMKHREKAAAIAAARRAETIARAREAQTPVSER